MLNTSGFSWNDEKKCAEVDRRHDNPSAVESYFFVLTFDKFS